VGKGTTCETLEGAARVLSEHGIAARADFSFILPLGGKDDRQTLTRLFPDIALFHPDILRDDWIIVRHVVGGNA